jgi:hypothetical protein
MQMLATELQLPRKGQTELRPGLVEHLAKCEKDEATRALARMAIFSPEDAIRQAALEQLQKRDTAGASDILLQGLRYPWPTVAISSAAAIAQLKRDDLTAELVKMLEEPDPRTPIRRRINGNESYVVRELVRINHLRNCLLCHPPGNTPDLIQEKATEEDLDWYGGPFVDGSVGPLTAEVPTPGERLPSRPSYYGGSDIHVDLLVRADVTYLRQDFSLLQKVADADPWPDLQRFDYLVRERVLTDEEALAYHGQLAAREEMSPYREAALNALRQLTGQDAGATAQAWREALGIRESVEAGSWMAIGCTSLFLLIFLLLSQCYVVSWVRRWRCLRCDGRYGTVIMSSLRGR